MDFAVATIIALILGTAVSLTDKWILTRLPPRTVLAIIGIYGFLTLLLLPLTASALPSGWPLFAGLGIGVVFAILIYCAFRAIEQEEISRLAPLGVLSTVLVILGGILFFGEPITLRKATAFAMFMLGSFFLATRFERQLLIFEPNTYTEAFRTANHHVRKTIREPIAHTSRMTQHASRKVRLLLKRLQNSPLLVVQSRTRPKLVKGFWWYISAILLSVIVIIGMKWLSVRAGTIPGFVSMRLGMAITIAVGIIFTSKSIRSEFGKHPKAVLVAAVKEPFGILIGFLLSYAYATGDLGTIRSIMSMDSVLLLISTVLLTRFGIMRESLAKKDIAQKAAGIVCMISGTLLLFL